MPGCVIRSQRVGNKDFIFGAKRTCRVVNFEPIENHVEHIGSSIKNFRVANNIVASNRIISQRELFSLHANRKHLNSVRVLTIRLLFPQIALRAVRPGVRCHVPVSKLVGVANWVVIVSQNHADFIFRHYDVFDVDCRLGRVHDHSSLGKPGLNPALVAAPGVDAVVHEGSHRGNSGVVVKGVVLLQRARCVGENEPDHIGALTNVVWNVDLIV